MDQDGIKAPWLGIKPADAAQVVVALANWAMANFGEFDKMAAYILTVIAQILLKYLHMHEKTAFLRQ